MSRTTKTLLASSLVLGAFLCAHTEVRPAPPSPRPDEPDCPSCSGSAHAQAPASHEEVERLVAQFASEPMTGDSPALEALVYHGAVVRPWLAEHEAAAARSLDPARLAFLREELELTHAVVEFRIVDEHGTVRARQAPVHVRLGEKQHLHATHTVALQPPEFSGTVLRVGLHHLWARY